MNALTKQAASFSESMIPQCLENAAMDPTLFDTYGVKRGLRDKAGNGVVAGLTNISDVSAYWFDEQGNKHPQEVWRIEGDRWFLQSQNVFLVQSH